MSGQLFAADISFIVLFLKDNQSYRIKMRNFSLIEQLQSNLLGRHCWKIQRCGIWWVNIPWPRHNSSRRGLCRNARFLHGCFEFSYRLTDKSKNPCPCSNHTFPNSVHHQNLESSQPAASCFPTPDDARRWEICNLCMGTGSCYIVPLMIYLSVQSPIMDVHGVTKVVNVLDELMSLIIFSLIFSLVMGLKLSDLWQIFLIDFNEHWASLSATLSDHCISGWIYCPWDRKTQHGYVWKLIKFSWLW